MEEIFSLHEGVCPNCGSHDLKLTVTAHPDREGEVNCDEFVPNENMPTDFTFCDSGTWAGNLLSIWEYECRGCEASFYLEQSAIDGDWAGDWAV